MTWLENIVNRISFEFLLIAPLCAAALVGILSFFFFRKRAAVWLYLFVLSLSCGLLSFHAKGGGSLAFGYGCLLFAIMLLLLLAPSAKHKKGEGKEQKDLEQKEKMSKILSQTGKERDGKNKGNDIIYAGMPLIKKDIVNLNEAKYEHPIAETGGSENADVQLEHVFQVLKKLQSMKLSAGDRLETDVIRNMLNVYQAKGALSAEETRALNNYLATLLKLMSKYSV